MASGHAMILIVISDGFPQDSDYGRSGESGYGVEDTARAL